MRATTTWSVLGLGLLALSSACSESDDDPRSRPSIASQLMSGLSFPQSMVIDAAFPETTDPSAMLLPLGPTVVVTPAESGLMALRVQDPKERAVEATLIQFSDASLYVRVGAEEGEGSHIIENDFSAEDDLCAGLCDAVFTVTVTEAVEFADGAISQVSTRQIVVDCREHGDPSACGDSDPSADTEELLCGDVTTGETAWIGDPVLDAHLEAVRLSSEATRVASETLESVRDDMVDALAISSAIDAVPIASALQDAIEAHTEAGLSLLLAEQGCALTLGHVSHVLHGCDAAAPTAITLGCSGVCEPAGPADACAEAESSGCRGVVDEQPCQGRCTGACEVALDEPAECAGTCIGTCDGECPGDSDDCQGPCMGLCTGTCHVLSADSCDGPCTGLCDAAADGVPDCDAPLTSYCAPASDDALACAGDCFGAGAVDVGGGPCSASALAIARALPRCEPPFVQLSFTFLPGGTAVAQNEFAGLVQAVNGPFAQLFGLLARIDLLLVSNAELLAAAEGEIADHFASIEGSAEIAGLACAEQRLPEAAEWLASQPAVLEQLRADAMLLVSTLTVAE